MLDWIELHPLATTILGGVIVLFIGYIAKRIMGGEKPSKSQILKNSNVGRDLQQADVILNQPSFHTIPDVRNHECKIKLAPSIKQIHPVMNGGKLQGDYANFQVRFRAEADLELKEAS